MQTIVVCECVCVWGGGGRGGGNSHTYTKNEEGEVSELKVAEGRDEGELGIVVWKNNLAVAVY